MGDRVFVCRWVSGGVSIKDQIRAPDLKAAVAKAKEVAKERGWILKAVVSAAVEYRTVRPENR